MNKLLSKTLIFAAGVVIGSTVTWKLIKDKYAKIADEEIESVKKVFSRRAEEESESESKKFAMMGEPVVEGIKDGVEAAEKRDYERYASVYATASKIASVAKDGTERSTATNDGNIHFKVEEEKDDVERPYVISPEEFGELGYDTVSLTYYDDGVLTDDMDYVIDDVDDIVGEESLTHFGEYEDDSVFVRNDARETDYEILADARRYSDIYPDHP